MSAPENPQNGQDVSVNCVVPENQAPKVEREDSPPAKKIKTETSVPKHKEAPIHEIVGGSSVRQYLNKHLTQHLLEGLKQVSKEKPEDPLASLGQFLIQRSEELKKASEQ